MMSISQESPKVLAVCADGSMELRPQTGSGAVVLCDMDRSGAESAAEKKPTSAASLVGVVGALDVKRFIGL
ncbi:hypothetical protein QO207_31395 [Pseudomonas sp. CAN2814]|nr:hypothetical protein [Pseudomonas sp. CAN1]